MKICFISQEQYGILLRKLRLNDQETTDLPGYVLLSRERNTLFIVGKPEDHLIDWHDAVPNTWKEE